jgi:hypothetical protein
MISTLTTLAPLIGGFLMGMVRTNMEYKAQHQQHLLDMLSMKHKSQLRAMRVTDKGVAWTRRVLALSFSFSLIAMVGMAFAYGFVYPEATINVPQEVIANSFLSFLIPWVDPVVTTEYVQLQGFTVAMPLLIPVSEAVLMIVGFYFGSGGTGKGRG